MFVLTKLGLNKYVIIGFKMTVVHENKVCFSYMYLNIIINLENCY